MIAGSPRLGLATRVMLGAAVSIALAAAASVYLIIDSGRRVYLANRGAALENRVMRNAELLRLNIDALRRDVLFLSKTPPVQGIIRAAHNNGIDPVEGWSGEIWTRRLQEIFTAFAGARSAFFQLRFIGVAGNVRELGRVDLRGGQVVVASIRELQSKADRDYFQAALKLKAGEVYLSGIDINHEQRQIQVPHVRTLRKRDSGVCAGRGDIRRDKGAAFCLSQLKGIANG